MEKKEWETILADAEDRALRAMIKEKGIPEIDDLTKETTACLAMIELRYRLLKGEICSLLASDLGGNALLRKVGEAALRYRDCVLRSIEEKKLAVALYIKSESRAEAVRFCCVDARCIRGLLSVTKEFADFVWRICDDVEKVLSGEKKKAVQLIDPWIEKRLESGETALEFSREQFVSWILYIMNTYDAATMPFLSICGPTLKEEEEIRFPYFDLNVNKKALKDLLKELYEIDEETAERFEEDPCYVAEVAFAFVQAAARVMTPKGRRAFFLKYGMEDGVCRSSSEVAERMGVTREKIRQVIEREKQKLKNPFQREEILSPEDPDADFYD